MSLRSFWFIGLIVVGCRDSRTAAYLRTARLGPPSGTISVGNEPRALELADGRVAITMMGLHGVVVHNFDSGHADTLGRSGAGPGEFERSDVIFSMGGTRFGVLDPVLRRATIYANPDSVEAVIPFATVAADERGIFRKRTGGARSIVIPWLRAPPIRISLERSQQNRDS
jgi:hypothetical protein